MTLSLNYHIEDYYDPMSFTRLMNGIPGSRLISGSIKELLLAERYEYRIDPYGVKVFYEINVGSQVPNIDLEGSDSSILKVKEMMIQSIRNDKGSLMRRTV